MNTISSFRPSSKIDVRPKKISKPTPLETISEVKEIPTVPRTKSIMKRQLMRQTMMTIRPWATKSNPPRKSEGGEQRKAKWPKLQPGLALLKSINAGKTHL